MYFVFNRFFIIEKMTWSCRVVRNTICLGLLAAGSSFSASAPVVAPTDLYESALHAILENRREDAALALMALQAAEPRHAGAWLDLAMLHCSAGDGLAAEKVFAEIELRFAPPPPILEVIAHQRLLGCRAPPAVGRGDLRLSRGVDNNVNQGAQDPVFSLGSGVDQIKLVLLPAYQPLSSQFSDVSGEFAYPLASGVEGFAQVQARHFDVLPAYNTRSLVVGAQRPWRLGEWDLGVAMSTGVTVLADQLYLRQSQVQLSVLPPLGLPEHWGFGVTGNWSAMAYPALTGFDARWRELRAALTYTRAGLGWQGSLSGVQDVALGSRPGGDRSGVFAAWRGHISFANQVRAELGWQRQRWAGSEVYSPGVIDTVRVQNVSVWRAAATVPVSEKSALMLELKATQNAENISIFSFTNQLFQVSWLWHL